MKRSGPLRHRGYRRLLYATAGSNLGVQVKTVALPLIAVLTLHATAFQVGLISAAESAGFLLVGLPAGVWADRFDRRRLLICADATRFAGLLCIPLLAPAGLLDIGRLAVLALITGIATVIADVTHMSFLPSLVTRDELVAAGSGISMAENSATAAGLPLGGLVSAAAGPQYGILGSAAGFLCSAGLVRTIPRRRGPEPAAAGLRVSAAPAPAPVPAAPPSSPSSSSSPSSVMRRSIAEGLRFVWRQPALRAMAATGAIIQFCETGWLALQPLLLVRELGISPGWYGLLLTAGAAGGIAGAVLAARLQRHYPLSTLLPASLAVSLPFLLILPLAQDDWRLIGYGIGSFVGFAGLAVYNVNQVALRQLLCPDDLRGRMNATMRFFMWGAMPLGGLAGGVLGTLLGVRTGMCLLLAALLTAVAPVIRLRGTPVVPEPEPAYALDAGRS